MARERFRSLDVLRGATIFAMTLCAAIGWHSDLPAWMFHCQVPPPDYAFHPEVRGITWVDMVFPFFLFTMGAVLPFSLVTSSLGGGGRRGGGACAASCRWPAGACWWPSLPVGGPRRPARGLG